MTRDGAAIVLVVASLVQPGPPELRFPDGSRIVSITPGTSSPSPPSLTPDFFGASDPRISFDGKAIVFAGQKRKEEQWQIWEMSLTGDRTRQITHCAGHCLEPALLSENQIAYTMVTSPGGKRESAVYVCDLDGDNAHPITFGPGNYEVEAALRNGRILLSAEWPLVAHAATANERTLYTILPDGSGLTLVRDHLARFANITDGTELTDGSLLFIQSRADGKHPGGGQLALLRRGALDASTVLPDAEVYESAEEMPGNDLLISRRSRAASGDPFSLYLLRRIGKPHESLLYSNRLLSAVQPVPLLPHDLPPCLGLQVLWPANEPARSSLAQHVF